MLCLRASSPRASTSSCVYKYPVGLHGLQIKIALVLVVIFASIDAIEGRRNCSSKSECTGTTLMFEAAANPL